MGPWFLLEIQKKSQTKRITIHSVNCPFTESIRQNYVPKCILSNPKVSKVADNKKALGKNNIQDKYS